MPYKQRGEINVRPAEVTPAVLASCGSVRQEINRKSASLVTREICRGVGEYAGGSASAAGEMRNRKAAWLFSCFIFHARVKLTKCLFKGKTIIVLRCFSLLLLLYHTAMILLGIHIEEWE